MRSLRGFRIPVEPKRGRRLFRQHCKVSCKMNVQQDDDIYLRAGVLPPSCMASYEILLCGPADCF